MASQNPNAAAAPSSPDTESPLPQQYSPTATRSPNSPTSPQRRSRNSTNASNTSVTSRVRSASLKLMDANPPPGMWAATGSVVSKAPSLSEIRGGHFCESGWSEESQRQKAIRRGSSEEGGRWLPRRTSSSNIGATDATGTTGAEPFPAVTEEEMDAVPTRESTLNDPVPEPRSYGSRDKDVDVGLEPKDSSDIPEKDKKHKAKRAQIQRQYTNGYVPPPKIPWKTSTVIGLKAFWKWFLTIPGFLITLYGLNVVAWGGMLFLLLCNASPAMCKPSCNDIQSPRRIWIEIDSQILNGLFCVTGFGLAPWRARDLYFWALWRLGGSKRKDKGIRTLAGIHRGWFRLPGSENLSALANATTVNPDDMSVPLPHEKIPDPPPTGHRASPTKGWKMDFVVWMNWWNTLFQVVLCFYMYHYNRYARPSWATGTFVALGCIVAGLGGIMMWQEGKRVKHVEGVPAPKPQGDAATDVEAQHEQLLPSTAVANGAVKS